MIVKIQRDAKYLKPLGTVSSPTTWFLLLPERITATAFVGTFLIMQETIITFGVDTWVFIMIMGILKILRMIIFPLWCLSITQRPVMMAHVNLDILIRTG